jgi:hypothetical protein
VHQNRNQSDLLAALTWFRQRFFHCSDRVALVKTWLPAQSDGPAAWLYPLVYERALMLVRSTLVHRRSYAHIFAGRVVRPLERNCLTKRRLRMSVRSSMRSPCGASTHFRTTYFKQTIRSLKRTALQSTLVSSDDWRPYDYV